MPDEKIDTDVKVDEEDDFEFGSQKGEEGDGDKKDTEADSGEEKKKGSDEDKSDDAEKPGEGGGDTKRDEDKTEDGEGSEEKKKDEDADKGAGTDDKVDEKGDDKGKGDEGESGETKDFFLTETPGESDKDVPKFDYKGFGEEFGITEVETKDDLKVKINERIENAKKEFKINDYSADAQSIIKHLNENEGKVEDFFANKNIASLQSVIGLASDQKVLFVRTNELTKAGIENEKANEQALEEIKELSTREIKDMADSIDADANKLISDEVNVIIEDRKKIVSQQKEKSDAKVKSEVSSLKDFVNSQNNFMGIVLSEKAKMNIVQEIDSGVFDSIAEKDPAASKFTAYMIAKHGKKIIENYDNIASEQNRKGHNAALDKQTGALHKSKEDAQQKKTGRQQSSEGSGKNFDSWSNDLFDEDAE